METANENNYQIGADVEPGSHEVELEGSTVLPFPLRTKWEITIDRCPLPRQLELQELVQFFNWWFICGMTKILD
jgi:hypothetical protein